MRCRMAVSAYFTSKHYTAFRLRTQSVTDHAQEADALRAGAAAAQEAEQGDETADPYEDERHPGQEWSRIRAPDHLQVLVQLSLYLQPDPKRYQDHPA